MALYDDPKAFQAGVNYLKDLQAHTETYPQYRDQWQPTIERLTKELAEANQRAAALGAPTAAAAPPVPAGIDPRTVTKADLPRMTKEQRGSYLRAMAGEAPPFGSTTIGGFLPLNPEEAVIARETGGQSAKQAMAAKVRSMTHQERVDLVKGHTGGVVTSGFHRKG